MAERNPGDERAVISVDQARSRILSGFTPTPTERIPLLDALGLTLARDVVAPIDLPPFPNAAMDGYAVRAADVATASVHAPTELAVIGEVAAGSPVAPVVQPGTAVRIMTGALLPAGATAVVPFELTEAVGRRHQAQRVRICRACPAGANIRLAGEAVRQGAVALPAGTVIGPATLGVLSSLGQSHVLAHRRPRIAILSTGDELVPPGTELTPGTIYDSNGIALAAAIRDAGGVPISLGIAADRVDVLWERLRAADETDLILTSGGVSHGDYDVVKDLLAAAGHVDFWQVAMRPGRPLGFGWLGARPLIGLAGNPGAALVGFEQFVRPVIRKLLGRARLFRPEVTVIVRGTATNRDGRRCFLRAQVELAGGDFIATLGSGQGSGTLISLATANALVVVPETQTEVHDGDRLQAQLLSWDESGQG